MSDDHLYLLVELGLRLVLGVGLGLAAIVVFKTAVHYVIREFITEWRKP